MDAFFQAMAPVLAANLLTAACLYGFFRRAIQESRGEPDPRPLETLGPILLTFMFLGFGLVLSGGDEWLAKTF